MKPIYLERHDEQRNMHRFYQLYVTRGLFDDWSLVKEWGRVGSTGTVRKAWFSHQEDAEHAADKLLNDKFKKGYSPVKLL